MYLSGTSDRNLYEVHAMISSINCFSEKNNKQFLHQPGIALNLLLQTTFWYFTLPLTTYSSLIYWEAALLSALAQ
jgi:hypothetical protein